jgi:hypothetical protein
MYYDDLWRVKSRFYAKSMILYTRPHFTGLEMSAVLVLHYVISTVCACHFYFKKHTCKEMSEIQILRKTINEIQHKFDNK